MKSVLFLLAAGATLAAQAQTPAPAEPARSLNKARAEINNGTAPGIVIFKSKPKADAPAAVASAASAAVQGPVPVGDRVIERLRLGEPPSGQPLNDAKRLDSPTQGIPLPTAATAASAAKR